MTKSIPGLAAFFISLLTAFCAAKAAPSLSDDLRTVIGRSRAPSSLGVSVTDLQTGEAVFRHNEKNPLKPASVLKVLTSIVALYELGAEYRFKTEVLVDEFGNGRVNRLWIKGGGDPEFTTDKLLLLVRKIKKSGVNSIGSIYLDDTLFMEELSRSGQRAYQTGNSALAFNYNSIEFYVCPREAGAPARVSFDPWELPAQIKGSVKTVSGSNGSVWVEEKDPSKPLFAISGTIGAHEDCVTLYRSLSNPLEPLTVMLAELLKENGIKLEGKVSLGKAPTEARFLLEQSSIPLSEIVADLNHFSNNFIGQQVVFALGERSDGAMSHQAGIDRLSGFLTRMGYEPGEFRIMDGSGLSHENRLSARILDALLTQAYRSSLIGPEFLSSLSVGSQSGTMKKRNLGNGLSIVRAKTGTIDGVSTLAGYVFTENGKKYSFSILQNAVNSKAEALNIENEFVRALIDR